MQQAGRDADAVADDHGRRYSGSTHDHVAGMQAHRDRGANAEVACPCILDGVEIMLDFLRGLHGLPRIRGSGEKSH